MKLDKETVVKHQFWFLLGGYLLVWIIAVFWLKIAAGDEIKKVADAFETTKKNLDNERRSPVNTRTFVPPWEAYRNVFEKHKQVIWNQAWDFQRGMYDWPFSNKDMSSPQTVLADSEREEYKRTLYPDEIKQLREASKSILGPVELAGGFDAIFKPQEWKETPTREECWLAQEDYWVKRELLYVVGGAVAQLSYMWPILQIDEKAEPMPQGVVSRHRYRNQNWEITFHIRQNPKKELVIGGDSTIKNVHPSGNPLSLTSAKGTGIVFNLMQDKTTVSVEVRGEPVPWGEAQKLSAKDYEPNEGIDWAKFKEKPIYVSQSYDWPTCPLRRIEAIALGHQDSRTFTTTLQANETLAKLDVPEGGTEGDATKDKDSNAAPSGAPGGGMMGSAPSPDMMQKMSQGSMGMMSGMKGGGAQGGNVTPNNAIERNRYLQAPKKGDEAEKPSRHFPFAIQVIVEQAHTHDVLAALANSRLRVQITQVDLHHAKGIKPEPSEDKSGDILRTGPVMMMGTMGGPTGGKMPPMMGPGMMNPMMTGAKRPPMMGGSGMMPPSMGSGSGAPPMMGGSMSPPPGMVGSGNNTMMMMMSSMKGNRGGSGAPGMVPPSGGVDRTRNLKGPEADKKTVQIPEDDTLVELTVYGIATLYRRPDPPKSDEAQPGQAAPAQPAQPASPTTPPAAARTGPAPAPGK